MSILPSAGPRRQLLAAAVGAVLLVAAAWGGARTAAPPPREHVLRVTARSWAFEPAVLRVRRGDTLPTTRSTPSSSTC